MMSSLVYLLKNVEHSISITICFNYASFDVRTVSFLIGPLDRAKYLVMRIKLLIGYKNR